MSTEGSFGTTTTRSTREKGSDVKAWLKLAESTTVGELEGTCRSRHNRRRAAAAYAIA